MRLQFLGAAQQVTGSQYFLESGNTRLMVDCGNKKAVEYNLCYCASLQVTDKQKNLCRHTFGIG